MTGQPLDACPKCGSDDLLVIAERVYHLDGAPGDDSGEQVNAGRLFCAEGCGTIEGDDADATVARAAKGVR